MPPKYVTIQGRVVSAAPADVTRDLKPIVRKYLGAEVGDAYVDSTQAGRHERDRGPHPARALVLAGLRQDGVSYATERGASGAPACSAGARRAARRAPNPRRTT